jgi:hypothetical protein
MSRPRTKNDECQGANVLAARIEAIRDQCHSAVKALMSRRRLSDAKLAECARLGDSLEATQQFLKSAVAQIAITRRKRQSGGDH